MTDEETVMIYARPFAISQQAALKLLKECCIELTAYNDPLPNNALASPMRYVGKITLTNRLDLFRAQSNTPKMFMTLSENRARTMDLMEKVERERKAHENSVAGN